MPDLTAPCVWPTAAIWAVFRALPFGAGGIGLIANDSRRTTSLASLPDFWLLRALEPGLPNCLVEDVRDGSGPRAAGDFGGGVCVYGRDGTWSVDAGQNDQPQQQSWAVVRNSRIGDW